MTPSKDIECYIARIEKRCDISFIPNFKSFQNDPKYKFCQNKVRSGIKNARSKNVQTKC